MAIASVSALQPGIVSRDWSFPTKRDFQRVLVMRASKPDSELVWEEDKFTKYSGYISEGSNSESELKIYDPDEISRFYNKRPVLLLRRLLQISFRLGGWLGSRYLDSVLGQSDTNFKKRAGKLREVLAVLGPAFVKIAQAVSSRPDLIPPAYIDELSLLQDKIAPFSSAEAMNIIESELGVPVDVLFSEMTPEPVAAASLGQVYQARLRANGEVVAVKVQRPGVKAAIALDVFILRILAGYARSIGKLNTDLQAVVDEWASSLFREMDYEAEARSGTRFRRLFGRISNVKVPRMYEELSSERVLVMEWIEGEKLSEAKDLRLVEVGTYCSLTQLLDNGFYHADPHPGNLLCTEDGKLAYIDFGMMGEIKQNLREALVEASLHLVNRDFGALAGDFVSLGLLPPTSSSSDVAAALTGVFEAAVSKGVSNLSFGDLSGNLGRTMYKFKFRIPSYFSLVIRSLTVLEGVAINIDPTYKVLGRSYPWIARKVLTDNSPALRSALYNLLYKDGSFQIDRLESLISESARSTTASSLDLESNSAKSYVNSSRVFAFILTDEGDYVRDILLSELVKGLDALTRSTAETVLSSLPVEVPLQGRVFEPEDERNLDTLRRLLALLNATNNTKNDEAIGVDLPSLYSAFYRQWLSVLIELPFPLQQKMLVLPFDVAVRLMSRALARGIRSSILEATKS